MDNLLINSLSTRNSQYGVDIQSSCSVSKDNLNVTENLFVEHFFLFGPFFIYFTIVHHL